MNKDIEKKLRDLRLANPSSELKARVLANAKSAWRGRQEPVHMRFRQMLALAASLVIFVGVIVLLNRAEENNMRLAMQSN